MVANLVETVGELKELLADMRHRAQDVGYGIFPGGDPRTFTPDPECSTPDEQAAWKSDCERTERGEAPVTRTACYGQEIEGGAVLVTPKGYGFGTYIMEDPDLLDDCERLERAIQQLESYAAEAEQW